MTRAFPHLPCMNISQQMSGKVSLAERENSHQKSRKKNTKKAAIAVKFFTHHLVP